MVPAMSLSENMLVRALRTDDDDEDGGGGFHQHGRLVRFFAGHWLVAWKSGLPATIVSEDDITVLSYQRKTGPWKDAESLAAANGARNNRNLWYSEDPLYAQDEARPCVSVQRSRMGEVGGDELVPQAE